ncbi:hypothetical protein T03_584 [Trichinella britovi]|uniref:Uncharacterized protein n=1 Tax=Trichinella britovi TaxID=45882 RepID=A0A0V1CHY6_TRIBR|nr:hypothetical protein T03_584 [Trichinella britovi]
MRHGLCLIPDPIHPDLAESLYSPVSFVLLIGGAPRRRFPQKNLTTDLPMKRKAKHIADIQSPSDHEPSQSASQESLVSVSQSVTEYLTRPQRNHQQSTWMKNFRIIAASLSAYLYESCWLSKDQLLGYLWALNSRHSKQLEPVATWHRFGNFNLHVTIFLHLLSACIIWQLGKHIPSLKPTCLHDVWFHTFWLSVIHYVLSLTKLTALDTHWQPHLHEHINGFFKFFVITICLYVKPGCRFAQRAHNERSTHRTCITHVE